MGENMLYIGYTGSWPFPFNFPETDIVLVIHYCNENFFLSGMRNPILCGEFIPGHSGSFMHRIYYPFGMVFSRFDSSVINSEISAELESGLDDVPPVAEIAIDAVSDPEIRLDLSCS